MNTTGIEEEYESSILKTGLPCWRPSEDCGSSDAVSLYTKKKLHLTCFSCGKQTWDEEIVDAYMAGEIMKIEKDPIKDAPEYVEQRGVVQALPERKITKKTAERFEVQTLVNTSGKVIGRSFPFKDSDGKTIACKNKSTLDKKKQRSTGNIRRAGLFGEHLFTKSSGDFITITEGEEDAMAGYQMLSNDTYESPVVSIKNGAQSAVRDCMGSYEFINSFKNVIICFDMDEPGQKAAREVAAKFPGKARIMKMEHKDACDYSSRDQRAKFKVAWGRAEKFTPKGIYGFSELWDEMNRIDTSTKVPYPWAELNDKLYHIRTGELSIVKAKPKLGKTQYLREIAFHIQETTDHNVGIIFLEETIKKITQGFCSLAMNKPVHLPDTKYKMSELKEAFDGLAAKEQIHVFDPRSERTTTNLFSKMEFFVQALGCKFIFLDHITMFSYTSESNDERRFLDKFLADLAAFAAIHDVHIMAVMHVNDDGKTRGSRAPDQLCNVSITLDRDKKNPCPIIANTTKVIVDDDRFSGAAGLAVELFYDQETGRMTPLDREAMEEEILKDVKFDD